MINHHRRSLFFFIFSFIFLSTAFGSAYLYSENQSSTLRQFVYSANIANTKPDELQLRVTISKNWDDTDIRSEKPIGAQYDAVLVNNAPYNFKNWQVALKFSDDLIIDSSWNGIFTSKTNQVSFIAENDTAYIASGHSATFGTVMYSDQEMSVTGYILEGYYEVHLSDIPYFCLLEILAGLWLIALIIYSILAYKTIMYRKRLALDAKIIFQSMSTLTNFIDAKDAYTKNHSTRVAMYSSEIGRRLGLTQSEVDSLYYVALMHDCGKISIPDNILQAPGKLSRDEYQMIQSHTVRGKKMLANFSAIPNIIDGAHYHHERFDGNGYPEGLAGEAIPLFARIIAVADAYDAMSSNRCYRKALTKEQILQEMSDNSGKQFDPEINDMMIAMIKSNYVNKIQSQYPIT